MRMSWPTVALQSTPGHSFPSSAPLSTALYISLCPYRHTQPPMQLPSHQVVLYEDELADSGISLLTARARVMPTCWFILLRFWLRVDGALMRLRDSRFFCAFTTTPAPYLAYIPIYRPSTLPTCL
ncbi:unnamed protein product [Closterium sp. Naga37s-1]|nr:unnamed protein product [Closterium sp. Naga37s-1]